MSKNTPAGLGWIMLGFGILIGLAYYSIPILAVLGACMSIGVGIIIAMKEID